MSPCSRMLRCFRPPRSSSSVARLMPFWPGGTGQARCGFGPRWFYLNTCLRLHARGTGQLVFPLCGFPFVPRVYAHGAIRGEGALSSRGSGFGTGAGRSCHQGSLLSRRWGPEGEDGTDSPLGDIDAPRPLVADLFCGPNLPLSKAFLWCGWRTLSVDWLLDKSHDLSNPLRQQSLHDQLSEVDFICAAFDCSTKSRARQIPRRFEDGRPCPAPLRSEQHPDGLPTLQGRDLQRVRTDNQACEFILEEIRLLADRGGGSVRENPWRSLHWWGSTECSMMETGCWKDKRYDACCLGGARCKAQCLRHNIDEIDQWPPLTCHHSHAPHEWTPYLQGGQTIYPSKEEAEYTAVLAFAIAVAASWWAGRVGRAKLNVPRLPQFECVGAREDWLDLDPRALREWAMAPLALGLGLYPPDPSEAPAGLRWMTSLSRKASCHHTMSTWARAAVLIVLRRPSGPPRLSQV